VQVNYHSDFCDGFNATNPTVPQFVPRCSARNGTSTAGTNYTRKLCGVCEPRGNFTSQIEPDYTGNWVAPQRRESDDWVFLYCDRRNQRVVFDRYQLRHGLDCRPGRWPGCPPNVRAYNGTKEQLRVESGMMRATVRSRVLSVTNRTWTVSGGPSGPADGGDRTRAGPDAPKAHRGSLASGESRFYPCDHTNWPMLA